MKDEVDIRATLDERIMADGRPAYAWWSEIQLARADRRQNKEQIEYNKHLSKLLRLVEVRHWHDFGGNIHIIITANDQLLAIDQDDLLNRSKLEK